MTSRTPTPSSRQPTRTSPPTWLAAHLITTGHLTETGLTTRVRPRPCPTCRTWTLAALTDTDGTIETHIDPQPLTPLGEALALLERRTTWALHPGPGRHVLHYRDPWTILAHPAGTRPKEDIHREHACGTTLPHTLTAPTTYPTQPAAHTLPPGSPPPF